MASQLREDVRATLSEHAPPAAISRALVCPLFFLPSSEAAETDQADTHRHTHTQHSSQTKGQARPSSVRSAPAPRRQALA